MARPRKDQAGATARERIEQAFWELLEDMPYRCISVRALSERAGVNHNTFYYHFASIDDLVLALIDKSIPHEAIAVFASMIRDNPQKAFKVYFNADIEKRWEHFRLALRRGDPELRLALRDELIAAFLKDFGIKPSDLDRNDYAKVHFAFGGISALASSDEITTPKDYLAQLNDGIAQAVAPLLMEIINKHVPRKVEIPKPEAKR